MTTKDLLRKQVIIPINLINSNRFIVLSNKHIANINRELKNIKLDIMANFIWANYRELVITTNKIISTLDLNTVEKYIKNIDVINSNEVMGSRHSQFKSYLKTLDISYFTKNSSTPIIADIVKKIIQPIHIFNDVVLTS